MEIRISEQEITKTYEDRVLDGDEEIINVRVGDIKKVFGRIAGIGNNACEGWVICSVSDDPELRRKTQYFLGANIAIREAVKEFRFIPGFEKVANFRFENSATGETEAKYIVDADRNQEN